MKEMEEKIEEIIHKHEYWTMGAKESAKEIAALIEPYQKLIEAQDELIDGICTIYDVQFIKPYSFESLSMKIEQLKQQKK